MGGETEAYTHKGSVVMASPTFCNTAASAGIRKGTWSKEKDNILRKCMETYGEGNWHLVPLRAGKSLSMYLFNRLKRCRKSCRLRWLNYVSPNIKRGGFSTDEDDLIIRMQRLLGNRWSLIAGRMLGRTANDIKNYWSSHLAKRVSGSQPAARTDLQPAATPTARTVVYKPQAHRVSPRTCELLRHMYPASAYSFNPPSTSHPPDGIHVAAEQPAVAPEPSSFNLPSQPGEEEFALRGGGGDWFLDAQLDDGLHFGDSFLWDWTKDGDGSLPLC